MKLGIKVKDDGTLTAIVAETGEEIEGQVSVEADSGIERITRVVLTYNAYDKNGKDAIG